MKDIYSNREEYRCRTETGKLHHYRVTCGETDLLIASDRLLAGKAELYAREARAVVEEAIKREPPFLTSLRPLDIKEEDGELIRRMKSAGLLCHVGPMAAVAGAIAEYTGRRLLSEAGTVIIENGGDIFLASPAPVNVGIYAPGSILSGRFMLTVEAPSGMGVCTSSGTYGHSLSFGRSQAAVAVSEDTALADAAATRLGNLLKDETRIEKALEEIYDTEGIHGAAAIVGDAVGFIGDITVSAANF